ncbi:lipase member H isoform X1 [Bombyx mori]|uniref:Lipase domain-containing protein n=1 Tax=Bombyx mori TaxID=7091 RepID=A0A8R2GCG3_BOMMO|nr:lipase member H isoform X2 [Bombyx mori]
MARGFCLIMYFSVVVQSITPFYSSKSLEGYPAGYLSDCPGGDREAVITKNSLKYLTMTVVGNGNFLTAKRSTYTYYQMKQLAKDPNMDFSKRTAVYVGGYMDSPSYPVASLLAPQYRRQGYNVLLLDTNKFTVMEYPLAVRYIRTAARHTAEMLVDLIKHGLDPKKLDLIGLSLGAHTASFIAKRFKELTGDTISRLTGLDPAGPCFRNLGPDQRLDSSDADFVDVVDTNIDEFGMAAPIGHVNFYVNGGEYQPGDILWMPCNAFCSHLRSYTVWLAALQYPTSFIAIQCDSVQEARNKNCYDRIPLVTNVVGLGTDKSKTGVFYLATHNNYPYYLGEKGLKKEYEYFQSHMEEITNNDSMKI